MVNIVLQILKSIFYGMLIFTSPQYSWGQNTRVLFSPMVKLQIGNPDLALGLSAALFRQLFFSFLMHNSIFLFLFGKGGSP